MFLEEQKNCKTLKAVHYNNLKAEPKSVVQQGLGSKSNLKERRIHSGSQFWRSQFITAGAGGEAEQNGSHCSRTGSGEVEMLTRHSSLLFSFGSITATPPAEELAPPILKEGLSLKLILFDNTSTDTLCHVPSPK